MNELNERTANQCDGLIDLNRSIGSDRVTDSNGRQRQVMIYACPRCGDVRRVFASTFLLGAIRCGSDLSNPEDRQRNP